jgi:glycosyltransferase involved in cell wall biosynthesis
MLRANDRHDDHVTDLALVEAVPLAYALVHRAAEDLGIRVLFIKGPVARAQGLRGEHGSVDVDVLIDPARREALASALSELGWVDENPHRSPRVLELHSWTHRHARWPNELDLHDRFPGFFADPQSVFESLWSRHAETLVAGHLLPAPDPAGHALILALHGLRDPQYIFQQRALSDLVARVDRLFDEDELLDLATLADELGAADTAASFLTRVGAPIIGYGTTSDEDLRAWRLRTNPGNHTAVSWVEQLRRLPKRSWPGFLWYALVLSEKELRIADPALSEGTLAVQQARIRRLRRGLSAVPSAVKQVSAARAYAQSAKSVPPITARVVIVQEILTGYRVPFHRELAERLRPEGVELTLVHGSAHGARASRGDHAELPGAVRITNRHFSLLPGVRAAVWQPVPRRLLRSADLVVVEQASRHLLNYALLLRSALRGKPRVVFWGHGRNLQASGSLSGRASERLKALVSTRPHWWLAYTQGSADRIAALGFPRDRITVVQNAVAVASPAGRVDRLPHRCVYVGSLYRDKRIGYLLEASRTIAELDPSFRLVIIGDGEDRGLVEAAATNEAWLDYRGSMFGEEQAAELARAQLLLMPGLVGLAIVDSFVLECPMVTVDLAFHSPEVEYLEDGVNGVCLPSQTGPEQYAAQVAALLDDPVRLLRLRAGCRESAAKYTLEAMADNVASGLLEALRQARD